MSCSGIASNLALHRPVGRSSMQVPQSRADNAVDGSADVTTIDRHFATAATTEDSDPFFYVILDDMYLIQTVELYSRKDCCQDSMHTIEVRVGMY